MISHIYVADVFDGVVVQLLEHCTCSQETEGLTPNSVIKKYNLVLF